MNAQSLSNQKSEYEMYGLLLIGPGLFALLGSLAYPNEFEKKESDGTITKTPNKYKKPLLIIGCILTIVAIAIFAYLYFILSPRLKQAQQARRAIPINY